MVIDDVKKFLLEYYRQRHFDLMPDEVRARYDGYAKIDDFNGNMKWWKKELVGNPLPELDPGKQEKLFEILQSALQGMDADKKKFNHNKPVSDFIEKWFGPFKPFEASHPMPGVDAAFQEVHRLLSAPATKSAFERVLKNQGVIPSDISYDDFIDDIQKKKYNRNVKFRNQALRVAEYIIGESQYYGTSTTPTSAVDPDRWPRGARLSSDDVFTNLLAGGLSADINEWFKATYKPAEFESIYPVILDELLRSETIRKEFQNYDSTGLIVGQMNKAIEATDYDNPNSKDYIPPKANDSKNVLQRLQEWGNDTYESYLRKFTEPGRGTRLFFTPFSQTIIKALDKEKLKPTDGIAGIIAKKDAIQKRLSASSPTASKHFDWFAKKMGEISTLIPNAYQDALKGGRQLQNVVAQIIIKAVKENKVAEAKTALEILAVSKYGFTTSKAMDALGKENLSIFSDKDLSWNKNQGVAAVTAAMDKTIKFGVMAAGRALAATRNAVQRKRSKFNSDIRSNKDLNAAYKTWLDEDDKKLQAERAINTAHNVDGVLADLAAGHGKSGRVLDAATIDAVQAAFNAMSPTDPGYDDLRDDIDQYKSFSERKDRVDKWRDKNKDNYHELVAYWDLMMTAMKTHSFRLGTMAIRKEFLKNNRGKDIANQYIANYAQLKRA